MRRRIPFQNLAAEKSAVKSEGFTGIQLSSRVEDGACIVSAQFPLTAQKAVFEEKLSEELKQLAAAVYEQNGIIGHIKASVKAESLQMYSITDTILDVKNGAYDSLKVTFAFILYFIEPETAEEWTRQIIKRLCSLGPSSQTEES